MAAALWIGGGILYLVVEASAAACIAGYSYADNYISDLGKTPESPLASWMNAAFQMQGAVFVTAGALIVRSYRPCPHRLPFLVGACVYGAGSILVGLVPSGGTGIAATLHVAGATAAIVGGNLAVLAAARIPRFPRVARLAAGFLGSAGLASAALLAATDLAPGACERGAIYSIVGWQILAGVAILGAPLVCPRVHPAID